MASELPSQDCKVAMPPQYSHAHRKDEHDRRGLKAHCESHSLGKKEDQIAKQPIKVWGVGEFKISPTRRVKSQETNGHFNNTCSGNGISVVAPTHYARPPCAHVCSVVPFSYFERLSVYFASPQAAASMRRDRVAPYI